jgi:hypothetical protein
VPEETLQIGLEEGRRRLNMAVIAEPQKINGLTFERQVAMPKVKENLTLMAKIASSLYPDWVIQMGEDLRKTLNKE